MNRIATKILSCVALSALFVCAQALAASGKTVYKFKYNTVPLKQPVMTQSMKPGVAEYNKGNYVGAMIELEKVVKNEPLNSYAMYYLALCYSRLGYKSQAHTMYQNVITVNDNYSLVYYAKKGDKCIDNPLDEICVPVKKVTPPEISEPPSEDAPTATAQSEGEDDEITKFIKSGKKINPAAMDKITNERMIRKLQADEYSRQMAEEEARNRAADGAQNE